MNKTCFYIVDSSGSYPTYIPLKLTGRWKLTFVPYFNEPTLYLEHQGKFFKKWISENDIFNGHKQEEYTNKCDSRFYRFGQYHQHLRIPHNNNHD
ncbi:hypothetical protein KBD45_08470 [Candidatus Dojkabacteria bacterium]|nr:hypothetical protein [Candidatus Dojkabacteria bacterium]